ncbi:hypothetical protein HOY82DRAFT_650376 [Tuber indicum]|nr:hypothetical protein HOY82DRAFT_650376 [Tuber indicum]
MRRTLPRYGWRPSLMWPIVGLGFAGGASGILTTESSMPRCFHALLDGSCLKNAPYIAELLQSLLDPSIFIGISGIPRLITPLCTHRLIIATRINVYAPYLPRAAIASNWVYRIIPDSEMRTVQFSAVGLHYWRGKIITAQV